MATVRANQMIENGLYVMRTFRRTSGSNYLYDLVRFVSRTSSAKLNELKADDTYHVIIGEVPVKLTPHNGVLSRCLDGRQFRVTFQTEDTAAALGLDTGPADYFTGTPLTIEEVMERMPSLDDLASMPSLEEQKRRSKELRTERLEKAKALREQKESIIAGDPVEPIEPVIPPEPVEPVEPVVPVSGYEPNITAKAS